MITCRNCGYFWREEGEARPSCHYTGPDAWAPCEQDSEPEVQDRPELDELGTSSDELDELPATLSPRCSECPYWYRSDWDGLTRCHYDGPDHWSPCEYDDEPGMEYYAELDLEEVAELLEG